MVQIKLKTDRNIPISKFFLAKGTKKEAELEPEEKFVKADPSECVKEEPELKPNTEPSSTEKEEEESKSIVSSFPHGCAEKCQTKRDREYLSSKNVADESKKLSASPGKKKVKPNSANDHKQPTMLAYFSKK